MARSQYVWVVEHGTPAQPDPPHTVAAFTVKWELQAWWKKAMYRGDPVSEYTVVRYRAALDNPQPRVILNTITWEEL